MYFSVEMDVNVMNATGTRDWCLGSFGMLRLQLL